MKLNNIIPWLTIAIVLGCTAITLLTGDVKAAPPASSQASQSKWRYECYNTLDSMMSLANRTNYTEVAFIPVPSSRNFGGVLGDPYCMAWR